MAESVRRYRVQVPRGLDACKQTRSAPHRSNPWGLVCAKVLLNPLFERRMDTKADTTNAGARADSQAGFGVHFGVHFSTGRGRNGRF